MLEGSFIVDRSLRGVRVEKLLDARRTLPGRVVVPGPAPGVEDRAEVPASEPLAADRLYPSTHDPSRRYYLPRYALALRDDGHPEVQLRYLGDVDESGVLGQLRLTLAWVPPVWTGGELRTIDHRIELSLRFAVPVQGVAGPGHEQIVQLQPPQREAGNRATSITVLTDKAQLDAIYQAMRLDPVSPSARSGATLWLAITAEVGVRTWRQVVVGRPAVLDQVRALQHKKALFTTMLDRGEVAALRRTDGRATVSMRPPSVAEVARIHATRALLEDRSAPLAFTAGARAMSSVSVAPANGSLAGSASLLRTLRIDPGLLQPASTITGAHVLGDGGRPIARPIAELASPVVMRPIIARPLAEPMRPVIERPVGETLRPIITRPTRPMREPLEPLEPPEPPEPIVVPPVAEPPPVRPAEPIGVTPVLPRMPSVWEALGPAALAKANAPALRDAVRVTDLSVAGRRVVPIKIALDHQRRPAIVDTELETTQTLGFEFDPARFRDVFVGNYSGPDIHLLFPHLIVEDGTPRTIYTDNLMPEVVHVPPTEFRLVRDEQSPFAPTMTFVASDFVTTEEGDETAASVLYRVAVVYRLEPWVSPRLLELARQELERLRPGSAGALRFTPIVPRGAELRLEEALLGDGQQRASATIDPTEGITDVLDLDSDTFTRLWRRLAGIDDAGGTAGPGALTGTVAFTLFDGTRATSTVRISLGGDGADLVDVSHVGLASDGSGDHEVIVRNRVESPVELVELRAAVLPDGTAARPVGAAELVGRVLRAQERVVVRYRLDTPGADVPLLQPLVIGRSRPEPGALLKLLLRSESGFESLGFGMTVKAVDGSFTAADDGAGAITGLRVEFDDGTEIELTADAPQQEVSLVGRLLDQLTGGADDQHRYLYRVTNLHPTGEGARSAWMDGQGAGALQVAPAAGTLALPF